MLGIPRTTSESPILLQQFTPYPGINRLLVCAFILLLLPIRLNERTKVYAFSLSAIEWQKNLTKRSSVRVEGTVKDDHGGTLPKASVEFRQRNRTIKKVQSGEFGNFAVDLLEGVYRVVAKSEGCRQFRQTTLKVTQHTPMLTVTLKCAPTPILE